MKFTLFTLCLVLILSVIECQNETEVVRVTNLTDYEGYLFSPENTEKKIKKLNEEIDFWLGKVKERSNGYSFFQKIAIAFKRKFELTLDPENLIKADKVLEQVINYAPLKTKVSFTYQQVSNAISRHDFRLAKQYALKAIELDESKPESHLMLFDGLMELGEYKFAYYQLKNYPTKDNFDFLVRLSKYQDYQGDLDSAIVSMERAAALVEKFGNKSLHAWALSNLGDMYGHSGDVQKSYQFYLKALEVEPTYDYALRGIAWIAYSYDKDPEGAKYIITYLQQVKDSPDLNLLLADIAKFEGDYSERKFQLDAFLEKVKSQTCHKMYQKYLALLEVEENRNYKKAREMSLREIRNRPSPQSYDLLAWTHFKKGEINEALKIASRYVEHKTFEPEATYHLGMIYMSVGNKRSTPRKALFARSAYQCP